MSEAKENLVAEISQLMGDGATADDIQAALAEALAERAEIAKVIREDAKNETLNNLGILIQQLITLGVKIRDPDIVEKLVPVLQTLERGAKEVLDCISSDVPAARLAAFGKSGELSELIVGNEDAEYEKYKRITDSLYRERFKLGPDEPLLGGLLLSESSKDYIIKMMEPLQKQLGKYSLRRKFQKISFRAGFCQDNILAYIDPAGTSTGFSKGMSATMGKSKPEECKGVIAGLTLFLLEHGVLESQDQAVHFIKQLAFGVHDLDVTPRFRKKHNIKGRFG